MKIIILEVANHRMKTFSIPMFSYCRESCSNKISQYPIPNTLLSERVPENHLRLY